MKIRTLLPLAALVLAANVASAFDGKPYPEAGMFAPATAIPVAKGHPAWDSIISVESKGLPLRAVLAASFEGAKVQYAIDPGLDLTIYANIKDVTLRDAVTILNRLAEFDVRAEGGIWYASRRKPKVVGTNVAKLPIETGSTLTGAISSQTITVDTNQRTKTIVPMRVAPPANFSTTTTTIRTTFPVGATATAKPILQIAPKTVAKVVKTLPVKPAVKTVRKPALARRVTTRLPKTDLRAVFETFSQQTGVPITVDASVPRYKIDAFMKGASLKYALDKICEATGLRYGAVGNAVLITKR